MTRLAWVTSYLGDTPLLPRYELANKPIPGYFHAASSGDIMLVPDMSRTNDARRFDAIADSLTLHYALSFLIDSYPRGEAIGVLFGRRYSPYPAALGVMFDRGFATWDDPYGGRGDFAVPRQGCAVFLDSLAALHGRGTDAYVNESVFTAIHEMGHVFNLVHNYNEPNFMAGSERVPRDEEYFQFTHPDQLQLGLCSTNPEVAPGGAPYRDRDDSLNSIGARIKGSRRSISLRIHLAREQILAFEPIEMDIRIRASKRVVLPDEIDPGYPRFRIWIQKPSGEKSLYRSPRHYCPSGRTFNLNPGESFERDISIFGQSGGYTFTSPGEYKISADFQITSRALLCSNELKIEVLPVRKEWKYRLFLAEPEIARLLYYRRLGTRPRDLQRLMKYRSQYRRDPNAAAIDYAVGRIHTTLTKVSSSQAIRVNKRLAIKHLKRAADYQNLGRNARRIACDCLEEMQS